MGDPWGIVVVPTEAGQALSADGPCYSQPPFVGPGDGHRVADSNTYWRHGVAVGGLPLRWAGATVPEGWDRARRVCAELPHDQRPTGPLVFWLHNFRAFVGEAVELAKFLERAGLGRVVLLDLVDGAVVEREVPHG